MPLDRALQDARRIKPRALGARAIGAAAAQRAETVARFDQQHADSARENSRGNPRPHGTWGRARDRRAARTR
jgi:hypothetical protein